jgi:hypothetical protein
MNQSHSYETTDPNNGKHLKDPRLNFKIRRKFEIVIFKIYRSSLVNILGFQAVLIFRILFSISFIYCNLDCVFVRVYHEIL